jgi:hypothetical protein
VKISMSYALFSNKSVYEKFITSLQFIKQVYASETKSFPM